LLSTEESSGPCHLSGGESLDQDRDRRRVVVNAVMNIPVP